MSEFTEALKDKYKKGSNNQENVDRMNKQRVKSSILRQCETYLSNADDEFTFEVLKGELPYAVEVINEEPLKSKYVITQMSESIFTARLLEIDISI